MTGRLAPPLDVEELRFRAASLDGTTVGALAARLRASLPSDARRAKGRVGELVEAVLGATSGNLDQPDFPSLGVELKTVPLDRRGRVTESTYVCAIDLARVVDDDWTTCRVRRKLSQVLWIPVESSSEGPLHARRFGTPVFWQMDGASEARIRADWEELVGRIAVGGIDEISAHLGEVLQIRPKAASSRETVTVRGADGLRIDTVPRGFYLRAAFTESLLWSA